MGKEKNETKPMVATNEIFTKKVRPLGRFKYFCLELLNSLKRLVLWAVDFVLSMVLSLASFFKLVGVGLVKLVVGIVHFFVRKAHMFRYNDKWGRMSYLIFGMSSYAHGQIFNGVLYSLFEVGYIVLFSLFGVSSVAGLGTLGIKEYQPATWTKPAVMGDNSILWLIFGLLWTLSIIIFLYIWNRSINSGYYNYRVINFSKFEKVINSSKEIAADFDARAHVAYDGGTSLSAFQYSIADEIDKKCQEYDVKWEMLYTKYLLRNIGKHAYTYKKELVKRTKVANKAELKYEKYVAERAAKDKVLVEKCEAEKAAQIRKFDLAVENAADEVAREDAIVAREEELPLVLERIDVKLETFRNRTLSGTSDRASKLKKKRHYASELQKRYSNYVEMQSTRNNDKFGRFNRYFKTVAELDNELLFYKHFDEFKDIYTKSLDGADQANEDNKNKAVKLLEEKNAKIDATNAKFDQIYARKAEFDAQIKALKDEYNQSVETIKANGGSEQELLDAKTKLIEETTKLSNKARDLPSDKSIKGLYKEELKETKNAYRRDKKYIKTNYTPETYAREKVIDCMLIEYRLEYKHACRYADALINKQTKTFYTDEEVAQRINDLENRRSDYVAAHPDKYEGKPKSFKEQGKALLNENFHITILSLPILGIVLFAIVPLIFSIFVAFTNYSFGHIPPTQLFTWVGFQNFETLFQGKGVYAFLPAAMMQTLGWTFLWAFAATFSNYILGIIVALMINKKGIKLKKLWRTVFVMTIAIPQFISLLSIASLLKDGSGALDQLFKDWTGDGLHFATNKNVAGTKFIIILVNIWVGIPYTILSTTGILLNIPEDLYESARVDGAGTVKQFTKITMPYILFVTGPYLITQFVGNFNNFNVIFFLTGGEPKISGSSLPVGKTDLMITFLYKMITSDTNPQFGIASTVGIFIFMICAFVSIVMYNKTGAIKEEDQFQ